MKLERKHAVLFLAIAAWNVFSYVTFAKNLAAAHAAGEDRPTGYWVAHVVLIIVNLVIAAVLAWLGARAWRSARSARSARSPGEIDGTVAGEVRR